MRGGLRRLVLCSCTFCSLWLGITFLDVKIHAEQTRDPFVFGSRRPSQEATTGTLIGILWDSSNPLAIVGDQTVAVGDFVGSWEVIEIQQERIGLQRDGQGQSVNVGESLPTD